MKPIEYWIVIKKDLDTGEEEPVMRTASKSKGGAENAWIQLMSMGTHKPTVFRVVSIIVTEKE